MSERRPRQTPGVLQRRVQETLVLLDVDGGSYYGLNDVGQRVWELSDGSRSVDELIAIVCDEYDASPEVIRSDVLELLQELASEKLIVDGE